MGLRRRTVAVAVLAGCALHVAAHAQPAGGIVVGAPKTRPGASSPKSKRLTTDEARHHMLDLINRDRASMGLSPVEMEDGPAMRAGQRHADDMARNGYLSHWGTDGSVPEERFTDAGGSAMVLENASCFVDERRRTLDVAPAIEARNVEAAEAMFFEEKPPNDGHRRNILKPWHRRVGIGIAQAVGTATEIPVPCFAQEFVDAFGTVAPIPRSLRVGSILHVEGTLTAPAAFAGIGLARVEAPHAMAPSELNRRRSYPVPVPYEMVWPPGFRTPIPVEVQGSRFAVDLPIEDRGRPAMIEVSVWASLPGSTDFVIVSLRTIQVP
ncbi:MAG: CAP domain-containing protein [Polyangiaceae bacterium]